MSEPKRRRAKAVYRCFVGFVFIAVGPWIGFFLFLSGFGLPLSIAGLQKDPWGLLSKTAILVYLFGGISAIAVGRSAVFATSETGFTNPFPVARSAAIVSVVISAPISILFQMSGHGIPSLGATLSDVLGWATLNILVAGICWLICFAVCQSLAWACTLTRSMNRGAFRE